MGTARKRAVEIEFFHWTADEKQTEDPDWACAAIRDGRITFENPGTPDVKMKINTREGAMTADRGDVIIKGVKGELYACKPDIFAETYDIIPEGPYRIIVNGREQYNVSRILSYYTLREMAGMKGMPSMTYHKADRFALQPKEDGILAPGESVWVKDGTVINVAHTGNA